MTPHKRSRDDNDDIEDMKVEIVVEECPQISHVAKKVKLDKHGVQAEKAAAMLQDVIVHIDTMSPKTSVEVFKVVAATTKKLIDSDPNILNNLTDEQCKILIHLSKTILKNSHCKTLRKSNTLQKSKTHKQTQKGWWKNWRVWSM